jgi:hypothetical protein
LEKEPLSQVICLREFLLLMMRPILTQQYGRGVKAQDKEVKTCFLTAGELRSEHYSDDTFSSLPANCLIQIPIENERLLERIQEIMTEVK